MSKKTKDIIEEYSEMEDFGFSMAPPTKEIQDKEEELRQRLVRAEKLIMPLLSKLAKTAEDSDTIYWPNRREIIEAKIEELLSITRIEK